MKWILNKLNIFERFILPTLRRYDKTDAIRVTVFVAFLHEMFFMWFWIFTDRALPEYMFLGLTAIVAGGLGFDAFYRGDAVNINMREGSGNVVNPDDI